MKSKRTLNQIIFITLLFLHTSAFAIDVGRYSYIPITVNNTIENRWMEFNNLYEYDSDGNVISYMNTKGKTITYEYTKDETSDVIHCITTEGIEYSFAKDLEGREIYYNSKNETHYRSSDSYGNEVYHGYYSAKGNSRREWTEYEYYPNGQLKSKKIYTFSKN